MWRVNYKIYNGRRETEGENRKKEEAINKLLSKDVPLDILLITESCASGGACRRTEQLTNCVVDVIREQKGNGIIL